MNTHIITKDQIDADGFYTGASAHFDGHLEIAENLGTVRFKMSVSATGYIIAKAGSGIEAGSGIVSGSGIVAGSGIKAGWGIEAGTGIEAGEGIEAGSGIKAGLLGIKAGWGIEAGSGIEAGWGIKAGLGIEAGWGIKAGEGIVAGWGIVAGEGIEAKKTISTGFRIFAGLVSWRLPEESELLVTCSRLTSGTVAFGKLVETSKVKAKK